MNKKTIFVTLSLALVGALNIFLFTNAAQPKYKNITFNCSVKNNNQGCLKEIKCPTGYRPLKARVACNLEQRDDFLSSLGSVPFGEVAVLRASDVEAEGVCKVGDITISSGNSSLPEMKKTYGDFNVYCNEKDAYSGADCSISGEVQCKIYNHPMFENRLKFTSLRPPQGFAKLDSENWIATQDMDGGVNKGLVRFSLLDKWGDPVRHWDIAYGTHGQSVHINKVINGYQIFTEAAHENGFAEFFLDSNLNSLSFVKEIILKNKEEIFDFQVFGADKINDRVAILSKDEKGKKLIKFLKLSSALQGKADFISGFRLTGSYGSLQGLALSGDYVFGLFGNTDPQSTKYLLRIPLNGKQVDLYEISVGLNLAKNEGSIYEPEGIHVADGTVYFAILTNKLSRFYRMSSDFVPTRTISY